VRQLRVSGPAERDDIADRGDAGDVRPEQGVDLEVTLFELEADATIPAEYVLLVHYLGEPANLVLVDPAGAWTVDPGALASRSRNTPYAGMTLPVRVVATFLRGANVLQPVGNATVK
jgi:hypothetical protein